MVSLSADVVQLNATVATKLDAIRQVGQLLVKGGHIQAGYIDSMVARESAANTYLGNGIAIPHGLPQDRELILQTGIAVTQLPQGVEWNPGETVHLVVGIAAKSDEHLQILRNLTHVLDDPALIQRLVQTQNAQEIIEQLTQGESSPSVQKPTELEPGFDQQVEVQITGAAGLHARPATAFAALASAFEADIRVQAGEEIANGKSLMSLLKLGVESGQSIRILARGKDGAAALKALQNAIATGLEAEEPEAEPDLDLPALTLASKAIIGVAAAPGIAIAPLHHHHTQTLSFADTAPNPAAEAENLRRAVAAALGELTALQQQVQQQLGTAQGAIFAAHHALLADPDLIESALTQIPPNRSAAWAWQQTIEARAQSLAALSNETLAGRAADVRDVGQRVLRHLLGEVETASELPTTPVILIAAELTPSDTASLDPQRILGICTATGGPTSHTAILARSLKIPAVVGAGAAVLDLATGGTAILDGNGGCLYPQPSAEDLTQARQRQGELQVAQDGALRSRFQPALTRDGHRVEVVANIGAAPEAAAAIEAGAEGVGLLRTEFLFLGRDQPPSEAEQFAALQEMTQALNGLPLIVRTLDIGGDKAVPYLKLPAEDNPFLGVRGIRLCLQEPDLFIPQLRAICRAAAIGYVRIMFPMIATLEDLRAAKAQLEAVRVELETPPIEVGMMVEVPSAVLMAAEFAQEVDFFSIGTNDLTQYLLAMDRGHPTLAAAADALHPAVLRAIHQTVQAAEAAGKWVGVCGGLAGDPPGASLLVGLGVKELSASPASIPAVKAALRRQSLPQMQRLAQRALSCSTAAEVRAL